MATSIDNLTLHNVAEVREAPGGGWQLQRVPESVRLQLNPRAREMMLEPAGAEVRFVSAGPVRVALSCPKATPDRPCQVEVFYGCFQQWRGGEKRRELRIGPEPMWVCVEPARLPLALPEEMRLAMAFKPQVTRLMFHPKSPPVLLHAVEAEAGDLRRPQPEETPRRTMLSYGTSITHGSAASKPQLTYVNQCAVRLGVDAINLGSAGSAHCEAALADYIAGRDDWHFATLALSVNMMQFSDDEFAGRVGYMVRTVGGRDPRCPVFCITLWPHRGDYGLSDDPAKEASATVRRRVQRRRELLREAVADADLPNVHLLEGPDLLRDLTGLSQDLLHPGDNAMIEMGWRLADAIRSTIPTREKTTDES